MISKPKPERPFQQVAADFAQYGGRDFLIVVDCKTDWPDVIDMGHDTTATKLINVLTTLFCRTAVPDILWSDGGPQFTSALFAKFLRDWGVHHITSSPRYPQSNGKIEATVKSMKSLIVAAWTGRKTNGHQLDKSLLHYRNTPCRRDGLSPAQKLFGCPVQDSLPAHRRSFAPEWQRATREAEAQAQHTVKAAEEHYNQHARDLGDIQVGNNVAIYNPVSTLWDIYGTVTHVGPFRRYFIKTSSGRTLVRNRRFLRRRVPCSLPEEAGPAQETPAQPPPRRSSRIRQPPQRLIEDPNWP